MVSPQINLLSPVSCAASNHPSYIELYRSAESLLAVEDNQAQGAGLVAGHGKQLLRFPRARVGDVADREYFDTVQNSVDLKEAGTG
jgi:hypothetical protein